MQNARPSGDRERGGAPSFRGAIVAGIALASLTALLLLNISVLSADNVTARIGLGKTEPPAVVAAPQPVAAVRAPVAESAAPATTTPAASSSTGSAAAATQPPASGPDLVQIAEAQSAWLQAQAELQAEAATLAAPPASAPLAAAPIAPAAPATAPAPAATPAPVAQPAPAAPAVVTALSPRELGLLDAMNRARVANGLPPLVLSNQLLPIARARSEDLTVNRYFAHFSPTTGESVYTLTAAAGLRFSALGENLARVSGDATRSVSVAIEKLMQSAPHRANILSTAYTQVAVGAVTNEDNVTVFTTVFAGS